MRLNYKQTGQGKPVILIHGLFGSLENLNVIANALSDHFLVTKIYATMAAHLILRPWITLAWHKMLLS